MRHPESRLIRCVLLACVGLMAGCGSPGYNDNPSQQNTADHVGCLASTDFFGVYVNIRLQPADSNPDAGITRELFQPYCNYVPAAGKIFLTIDLVGNELRKVPFSLRVIRQEPEGDDKGRSESIENTLTVAEFPATVYPKGFIEVWFVVDKDGRYTIELTKGGDAGSIESDVLRIPLTVGVDVGTQILVNEIVTKLGITVGVIIFCFAVFRILRLRRII